MTYPGQPDRFKRHIINVESNKYFLFDNFSKGLRGLRKRIFSYAEITDLNKMFFGKTYALIELSYENNEEWDSRQLTKYIQAVIKKIGKNNLYDYAWVMEVKPIGRNLHYHLALHIKPSAYIPYPDKSGMWEFGSSHIYRGKSSPYYLAKYVSKEAQKYSGEFPKGARKYNTWLNQEYYSEDEICDHRKSAYPYYVIMVIEELGAVLFSVKRYTDGGWVLVINDCMNDLEGLEIVIPSPYVVCNNYLELKRWFPEGYKEKRGRK